MNKQDLVNAVADASGLSKTDSAKAVEGVFESITGALKSGGEVRLVGFGTFAVAKRKASTGRINAAHAFEPNVTVPSSFIYLLNNVPNE